MKGDIDQAADLAGNFDWTLNEECSQYNECNLLQSFTAANKAVFQVEYSASTGSFCADAIVNHRNAQRRELDLGRPSFPGYLRETCLPDGATAWQ